MLLNRSLAFLSTLGPIGKLPAPGTMGSLVAAIVGALIASHYGINILVIATILACVIGLPMAQAHFKITGKKDAGEVIIDEVAGQWIALLAIPIPPSLTTDYMIWLAIAFVLFRFFDILKPGPVRMAEQLQPNALGVMADDIVAGGIAGALIWLGSMAFNHSAL